MKYRKRAEPITITITKAEHDYLLDYYRQQGYSGDNLQDLIVAYVHKRALLIVVDELPPMIKAKDSSKSMHEALEDNGLIFQIRQSYGQWKREYRAKKARLMRNLRAARKQAYS